MRLIYSAEAVADLVRLRDFIAEQDPTAAARTAQNLIARMENLGRFPLLPVTAWTRMLGTPNLEFISLPIRKL